MPTYLVNQEDESVKQILKKPRYRTVVCFVSANHDCQMNRSPRFWKEVGNTIREQTTGFIGWARDWDRLCAKKTRG